MALSPQQQIETEKVCKLIFITTVLILLLGRISPSVIIAACLGRACPHPVLKHAFNGACTLPYSIEQYCVRRDNKYGVFFCSTLTLPAMRVCTSDQKQVRANTFVGGWSMGGSSGSW